MAPINCGLLQECILAYNLKLYRQEKFLFLTPNKGVQV